MFSKLSSLLLLAPLINALTINTPTGLTSGGVATITWSNAAGDPSTWSLELVNVLFRNDFAIANNVDPSTGTITLELPIVPAGSGYTLEAVDIGNITNVFATSGSFSIGPVSSVSTTSTSSSTSTSASASTTGSSSSTTTTVKPTTTPLTPATTTTGFGTTATNPLTTTSSSSSTTSASSSSTSQSSAAAPLKFALAASNAGAIAIALLGVVGGAVVFAL